MPSRAYSILSDFVRQFRVNVRLAVDRRRHLIARIVCRLFGIVLMFVVIGIGMLLCSALIVLAVLQRLLRGNAPVQTPQQKSQVMDGQYRIIKPESEQSPSSSKGDGRT